MWCFSRLTSLNVGLYNRINIYPCIHAALYFLFWISNLYPSITCMPVREVVPNGNPLRHRQNVQPPQRKAADQKDKTQNITIQITILFIYVSMYG